MFTVLSNTRNSNLYLIAALAITTVILLTFAVAPAISAPKSVIVPSTGISESTSDYFQRHPEVRVSTALGTDMAGDFYLRHTESASNIQNAAIPVTDNSEASDYFERHHERSAAGVATPLTGSLETPGLACESPVDCR